MEILNRQQALTSLLISTLFCTSAFAAEQPKATDLVGRVFGGVHALHIETDNDRLTTPSTSSYMDDGNGFGGEIGYRWLPSTEFRLSYSQFDLNAANPGFSEPDGASTSVDILYFPTEKNFYLMTGVNNLDIENSQISGNLGAGYRYYLNEKAAIYFESKANYQFSARYDELTAQIGFMYFFGDAPKTQSSQKKEMSPAIAPKDSDKDSVFDQNDLCPNTPMVDKVDSNGCTIFVEETKSMQLLVKFDNNSSIIKPEFHSEIKAMADILNANPKTSLTIEGHASSVGEAAYNKYLSQKRANVIIHQLVQKYGIAATRLTGIGYGEERLINTANNEIAHAENRRIMANLTIRKKKPVAR